MTQHYTLNTIEASAWCSKYGKMTPHRVAGRRLSYCIPCFRESERRSKEDHEKPARPVAVQERLF